MLQGQYTTTAEVRQYLGVATASTTDDALLNALIYAATVAIDNHCHRHFEARAETRYFGLEDTDGQYLFVDADLLSILLLRNGDSVATALDSSCYNLLPMNAARKHTIHLAWDYNWEQDTDCYISVQGNWGYSAEPPADVQTACKEYVAYLYRVKDSAVFDITANPDLGIITVPKGMPASVKVLLAPYIRLGIA